MLLLRQIDCAGVARRASRKMKRRVYFSQVHIYCPLNYFIPYRDRIPLGILINMINLVDMGSIFMGV